MLSSFHSFPSVLANHVWQSTVFAIAAGLLALALKENQARTRYWIWWIASVKFLVPFSLLVNVGSLFSWRAAPAAPAEPSVSSLFIAQVVQPFSVAFNSVTAMASIAPDAPPDPLTGLLPAAALAAWFCGCCFLMMRWWRRWRRVRAFVWKAGGPVFLTEGRELEALRRLEKAIGTRKPLPVMSSRAAIEPSVFGVFRSVLVWPAGLSERLEDDELEGILLHELAHVRRRDNLSAALHMVIEAAFWFHPLVWWLGVRLVEEREKACDEDVLRWGGASQDYAQGILKVCEFCLESPLVCAAGVTGSDLKKRVEDIMRNRVARRLGFGWTALLAAGAIAALAGPIAIGVVHATAGAARTGVSSSSATVIPETRPMVIGEERPETVQTATAQARLESPRPAAQNPAQAKEAFEVASIRTRVLAGGGGRGEGALAGGYPPACYGSLRGTDPRRLVATNFTLYHLIAMAYGGSCENWEQRAAEEGLSGGPDWIRSDRFDIEAVIPEGPAAYTTRELTGGGATTYSQYFPGPRLQGMLQTLLAERFKLVLRRETKEMPGYVLTVGKGGPKLTAWKEGDLVNLGCVCAGPSRDGTQMVARIAGNRSSMAQLADQLSNATGRPVLDRTGITGDFKYEFLFAPTDRFGPLGDRTTPVMTSPSLFTVIEEGLGLRLEAAKTPVETLVVERAERPSEN